MSVVSASPRVSSFVQVGVVIAALLATHVSPSVAAAPASTSSPTLTVSKGVAAVGEKLTFGGRIASHPNRKVVLQRRALKGWVRVARTTTSRAGRFRFVSPTPTRTTRYRVQVASVSDRLQDVSERRLALTTPVRTVVVRPKRDDVKPPGPPRSALPDLPSESSSPPAPSISDAPDAPDARPGVVFFDDFDGTGAYDHSRWSEWSACTYNGTAAYGHIGCGDRAHLSGTGQLVIPATPGQGTSISTKDSFRHTYGTFTARIKVPTQSGYWSAFWTLNSTTRGEATNDGLIGEADALEAFTKYSNGYRSAAHNYAQASDGGPRDNPRCGENADVRGSWHEYSVQIAPERLTFMFDGRVCWSTSKSDLGGKPYAFGPDNLAGNFMLLTNAIGNSSQGMEPPTEDSELLVDWVRVTTS